ncbi:phosphatidylinositol-specific phospholipase C1-like protein [Myroides sp. M-43]|uniref:Ca2+-dependent phosphoinositide-specific phospholipase C n=1 Tax=Myroides oncorhynchi TaxID=2893756 RepID=UPI001E2B74EB|nr:Ca2+-dependent phosphoinositide-specific phospholipase C [Myroides oncorhynchi]MCC9043684.1 phosphatidylinositol-specific phospholipase C1-like protein [Myroides oncorhynchi]
MNRKIKLSSILLAMVLPVVMHGQIDAKQDIKLPSDLRINQIQVLGTHNSYAEPVDPNLLDYVSKIVDQSKGKLLEKMSKEQLDFFNEYHPNQISFKESLFYEHPSFEVQLDSGLRSLELDVYYDSTGNRYTNPAGYEYLKSVGVKQLATHNTTDLDKPGFKVLHMADVDFRSKYPTLKLALQSIKKWSDHNADHAPLFIMIEAKDSNWPLFKNPTEVLKYDERAFDLLDQEIVDIIGRDKLITPDDLRGSYKTLKQAMANNNWPLMSESKGKVLFMLLPSTGGVNQGESAYVYNRPNLEGRIMFVQSKPTDSYGVFLLLDNAIVRQEDIKEYVSKGYLVRTRSDIDTYEAKVNDDTRAKAAFSSGAQVISTDFFSKDHNPYRSGYFIELPDNLKQVRINPVNYQKR